MQKLLFVISFVFLFLVQTRVSADNSFPKILILGDSLSAAYNIPIEKSWPALFDSNIRSSFPHTSVVNASISGETTFGGIQRLEKLLIKHKPTHLIIELGGNDGLQGLKFSQTTDNLNRMISLADKQSIAVMLIGVRLPPNLGAAYNQRFEEIYDSVATQNDIHYLPRFLEGVAASSAELMQDDGIHPTAAAQPILAKKVQLALMAMLNSQ